MSKSEVRPPWVEHPGIPPGDFYWREAGEAWFVHVWERYWNSLPPKEQDDYLRRWDVPDAWRTFYFDSSFRNWLESTDEPS